MAGLRGHPMRAGRAILLAGLAVPALALGLLAPVSAAAPSGSPAGERAGDRDGAERRTSPPRPSVSLATHGTFPGSRARVVPVRQWWWVRGRLRSPGARSATVRFFQRGRLVKQSRVKVRRDGRFNAALWTSRPGLVVVRAGVTQGEQVRLASERLRVRAVGVSSRYGTRSELVRGVQARLRGMGYVVPRSGVLDAGTLRAILAYRKVNRMARVTVLTGDIASRIARGLGAFRPKYPSHGKHIEADISRQVFAMLEGSRVVGVLHTSTGKPSTPTVRGSFRIYWKDFGFNSIGMLHSGYFIGGYAFHGYHSVPTYPASNGCLRLPNANALWVYNWARIGDRVDVYL